MNVELVSITKSLVNKGDASITAEQLIVYVARVSNPDNQLNNETADRLIAYLIKNKHWSPFEMVDMTVEIVTSRAIAAQILRHRSFSFQEFSQRYAIVTEMEDVQIRKQGINNRQGGDQEFDPNLNSPALHGTVHASAVIEDTIAHCQKAYQRLIAAGVAKECARMVLPLTTQTTIYMKGSVRSWIHYLQIRCDTHTQLEHRQVANDIKRIFCNHFPVISTALEFIN